MDVLRSLRKPSRVLKDPIEALDNLGDCLRFLKALRESRNVVESLIDLLESRESYKTF